nr:ribonuclease H-like domain-containing protein [Tanacetum cinerariifolium]
DPQDALKDTGIFDSGCSRHIIGNKSYLIDYQEYDEGFVAFAGSSKGGKITGKGKIRTSKLDFEDMYFVKELKFNLFSVSQMYDKKNSVLFTETECLILSLDFKLPDEIKYCLRTRKVEENLHVNILEKKPNATESGPEWLFDIDSLTCSMNYQPVRAGNRTNGNVGSEINSDAGQVGEEKMPDQEYILLPLLNTCSNAPLSYEEAESSPKDDAYKNHPYALDDYSKMPNLEDTGIFDDAYDDRDEGAEADYNNLEAVISLNHISSTRIHKDHPKEQIIREVHFAVQTRKMAKQNEAWLLTFINKLRRTNHKDFQNCLFSCFLSQMESKKVTHALDVESWVESM